MKRKKRKRNDNTAMTERQLKLQKKLNEISFRGCRGIGMGDVLYYFIECRMKQEYRLRDILIMFAEMFKKLVFSSYQFAYSGKADTLLLFSNSYRGRYDHLKSFKKVRDLLSDYVFVQPDEWKPGKIHYRAFFLSLCWFWQMRKIKEDFATRLFLTWGILHCYTDYESVIRELKKNRIRIRNFITLCDVMEVDCFFTQMLNKRNVKTITLQHGVFSSCGDTWPLAGSKSRYFVCWGQFTIDEGRRLGMDDRKMAAAGLLSAIGNNAKDLAVPAIAEKIGVLLGTDELYDDNVLTIKIAGEYCRRKNKKMYLRFHPASPKINYAKDLVGIDYEEIQAENVYDFAEKMDVLIVRISSTFLEMLNAGRLVYMVYNEGQKWDMFQNTEIPESVKFSDAEELDRKICSIDRNYKSDYERLRNYLFKQGDIAGNYQKVFRRLGLR